MPPYTVRLCLLKMATQVTNRVGEFDGVQRLLPVRLPVPVQVRRRQQTQHLRLEQFSFGYQLDDVTAGPEFEHTLLELDTEMGGKVLKPMIPSWGLSELMGAP